MGEILYKCNCINTNQISILQVCAELAVIFPETEFKEFEPRLKTAAQIWFVPLKIVFIVSRFRPAPNWNRFLADLRRGLNSLNSDSGGSIILVSIKSKLVKYYILYLSYFTLRKSVFLSTIQQIILLVSKRVAYMIQKDTL